MPGSHYARFYPSLPFDRELTGNPGKCSSCLLTPHKLYRERQTQLLGNVAGRLPCPVGVLTLHRELQVRKVLSGVAAQRPKDFTPAVFAANPFSNRIYRRIGDLPQFSADAEQVALKMGVIASVEHVLACLEEMQTFRAALTSTNADAISNDAEEEQLRLKIEAWSGAKPIAAYFRTIGLFRLLRNHYAHLNDKPHPALKSYIAANAATLNRFWAKAPTQLHGLDFHTISGTPLTFELAIAIVNLLRVSVLHIDEMLAATLKFDEVVGWLLVEVRKHPRSAGLTLDRLASKVRLRLEMEFAHTCGTDPVKAAIQQLS